MLHSAFASVIVSMWAVNSVRAVPPPPLQPNTTQTFFDDFSGPVLNATWLVADWEHLDACYKPEQVSLANGNLVLTAEHKPNTSCSGTQRDYVSGLVNTTGLFAQKGGIFEVRRVMLPLELSNTRVAIPCSWQTQVFVGSHT
jgi:hypothetical protein